MQEDYIILPQSFTSTKAYRDTYSLWTFTYLLFNCDYSGYLELDIRNLDLPISENKFKASLKKLYDEGLIYGDTQGNHREIYISDYQEKYVEQEV